MARLRPALIDTAYAAFFGAAVAGAAAGVEAGVGAAGARVIGRVVVGIELAASGALIAVAVVAKGVAVVAGIAAEVGVRVRRTEAAAEIVAGVAGLTGTVVGIVAVPAIVLGAAGIRAGVVAGAGAEVVGGAEIGISWILNRREVDQIARENIGFGMCVGSLAGVIAVASLGPLAEFPAIALVGGVAAGILSLIRG